MEYDLENPESWVICPPPPCDASFDEELLPIADRNPHGAPMLRKVWGATHRSKGELVYKLCDTEPVLIGHMYRHPQTNLMVRIGLGQLSELPKDVLITLPVYESTELGELRWIIERWVSPEELQKQGYYDETLRHDVVEDSTLLAEASQELHAMVRAGEDVDQALAKVESQVDRGRETKTDQSIKQYFDPEWRQQGDYQFFFRLERADGTYHPADGEALEAIAMLWHYNQTVTPAEHEARVREAQARRAQELAERRQALWHPDNLHARQPRITLS